MALAIGVLTAVGMIGFIRGFVVGEASVIGPTEYIRLVFAAFLASLSSAKSLISGPLLAPL